MEDSVLLNDLSCSKFNEDQHVLKEPLVLDCGHCICKSCIPNGATVKIKCNKCGDMNKKILKDAKPLRLFEKVIEMNLSGLYAEIEKQTSENIAKLKSLMNSHEETIELNVKFIEEEVEIRVESLKNELDKLLEDFKSKLADFKEEIIEKKSNTGANDLKIKNYEDKLEELRDHLGSTRPVNKEEFYNHQGVLRKLKKEVKQLEANLNDLKVEFSPSDTSIDENFIGKINFKLPKLTPNVIKDIFETNTLDTITVNEKYDDCVVLKNNQLLFSTMNSIELFDDQFNLLKTATKYNDKSIYAGGIAYDDVNSKIFISDYLYHRIIITDLELNFIKSFGDSKGIDNKSLSTPKDTKMALAQYPDMRGRMNLIDSYFYVFYSSYLFKNIIYVYDTDGYLCDEINIDRFSNSIGTISISKDDLLGVLSEKKQILKFKIK